MPKKTPLPRVAVDALKALPSYGVDEYVFPSKPTAKWPNPKKPYRWDMGKPFRALVRSLGIEDIRLHDLRHTGPSVLLMQGIPGVVVRKITGHRSRELERYPHQSNAGVMRRRAPVEMLSERPAREAERSLCRLATGSPWRKAFNED